METLQASVVICAYTEERWDDLVAAVASVQAQSVAARETIVVIDHNDSLLVRARMYLPGAIIVENSFPRGLSGARNSGVAVATGEYIAFLDDDAQAALDWLDRLCDHYADPRVVGVGGAIHPLWADDRPRWFPVEFGWVVGCSYCGLTEETAPVRNLIGANMSFRRAEIAAAGGFRDGVGQVGAGMLRCDDTEFCIRLAQVMPDRILLYEPCAQVFHHVTPARARWNYFRRRCYTEGMAKAMIARLVGRRDGLASERRYAIRALPQGIARSLRETIHGDLTGLGRAAAIAAGLFITASGYLAGIVGQCVADRRSHHLRQQRAEKSRI